MQLNPPQQSIYIRIPLAKKIEQSIWKKMKENPNAPQSDYTLPEQLFSITGFDTSGDPVVRLSHYKQAEGEVIRWMASWQGRVEELLCRLRNEGPNFQFAPGEEEQWKLEIGLITDNAVLVPLYYSNVQARVDGIQNQKLDVLINTMSHEDHGNFLRWQNFCREELLILGRILSELNAGMHLCHKVEVGLLRNQIAKNCLAAGHDVFPKEEVKTNQDIIDVKGIIEQLRARITNLELTAQEQGLQNAQSDSAVQDQLYRDWEESDASVPFDPKTDVIIAAGLNDLLSIYNTTKTFTYDCTTQNCLDESCSEEYRCWSVDQAVAIKCAVFCNKPDWAQMLVGAKKGDVSAHTKAVYLKLDGEEQLKQTWNTEHKQEAFKEAIDQKLNQHPCLQWLLALLAQWQLHVLMRDEAIGSGTDPMRPESYVHRGYTGHNWLGQYYSMYAKKYSRRLKNQKLVNAEGAPEAIAEAKLAFDQIWSVPRGENWEERLTAIKGMLLNSNNLNYVMGEGQIRQMLEDESAMDTQDGASGTSANPVNLVSGLDPFSHLNVNKQSSGTRDMGAAKSPVAGGGLGPEPQPSVFKTPATTGMLSMLNMLGGESAFASSSRTATPAVVGAHVNCWRPAEPLLDQIRDLFRVRKAPLTSCGPYNQFKRDELLSKIPVYTANVDDFDPPPYEAPDREKVNSTQTRTGKPINGKPTMKLPPFITFKAKEEIVNAQSVEHEVSAAEIQTMNQEDLPDKGPLVLTLLGDIATLFAEDTLVNVSYNSNKNGWAFFKGCHTLGNGCLEFEWHDMQILLPEYVTPLDRVIILRSIKDMLNLVGLSHNGYSQMHIRKSTERMAEHYIEIVRRIRQKNTTALILLCFGNPILKLVCILETNNATKHCFGFDQKFNDDVGEPIARIFYHHLTERMAKAKAEAVRTKQPIDPGLTFLAFNVTESLCNLSRNRETEANKKRSPEHRINVQTQLNECLRPFCDSHLLSKLGSQYVWSEIARYICAGMIMQGKKFEPKHCSLTSVLLIHRILRAVKDNWALNLGRSNIRRSGPDDG